MFCTCSSSKGIFESNNKSLSDVMDHKSNRKTTRWRPTCSDLTIEASCDDLWSLLTLVLSARSVAAIFVVTGKTRTLLLGDTLVNVSLSQHIWKVVVHNNQKDLTAKMNVTLVLVHHFYCLKVFNWRRWEAEAEVLNCELLPAGWAWVVDSSERVQVAFQSQKPKLQKLLVEELQAEERWTNDDFSFTQRWYQTGSGICDLHKRWCRFVLRFTGVVVVVV